MLCKIEKAMLSGIAEQVCTDFSCTWNQNFTTNVTAAPVNNIMFYTSEAKEKLSSDNTSSKAVNPTFVQKEKFLQGIAGKNEKVVALSLFEKFQTPFVSHQLLKPQAKLSPSLRALYREELSNVSPDVLKQECTKMFKSLSYEMHELICVEESTWNQNISST